MIRRDEATERQVRAADPGQSTWLSANAGSGKTKVLTDRVARLLLEGVAPLHILCLTYTKAAASEMQNRLFGRLGEWAMLGDEALARALRALGVEGAIGARKLREARRLFARAIETPGGLKIQTIHSFCASLLRRFPLESGVSPQFREMDERTTTLLRSEVLEEMSDGDEAGLVRDVANHTSGTDLDSLIEEIAKHRESFTAPPEREAIWRSLGLDPEIDRPQILARVLTGGEGALLRRLVPALLQGSATDKRAGETLSKIEPDIIRFADLDLLERIFLTGPKTKEPFSAKIGKFPTKATRETITEIIPDLEALMARIQAAREPRLALLAAERALALHRFAHAFLKRYEARKQAGGWLDFDDLILRAKRLLSLPGVAEWVLFRLDGGIDHILVDEAQDTSPDQWEVIRLLAEEFTTGEGARPGVMRTIFVVGDKKQSIYSFQGADPEGFDRMREYFQSRFKEAGMPFQPDQLEFSFRSAEPILRLVDHCFEPFAGPALGGEVKHKAFRHDMPGRADLWPLLAKTETELRDWHDPVDQPARNHHEILLARRIADEIARMIAEEAIPEPLENGGYRMRPVRAGDFLILVQGRTGVLFDAIISACKAKRLPIAGADVLKVGAELAVRDLVALLSFLATPEDDLSLAAALRSPLFGWSEKALYDLAHKRPKKAFLIEALRGRREEFPETFAMLTDLRDAADFLRPYELLERILIRHDGRRRLIGRLGHEAEDGIDALTSQAMAHEASEPPSLTGFLAWMEGGDMVVKRQVDSASDQIRVMTVHGAKGLEAPIVILPDTLKQEKADKAEILAAPGALPFWRPAADLCPESIRALRESRAAALAEERKRLLYVALTRAEKWLIVCGAGDEADKDKNWYETVRRGMEAAGAVECTFPFDPDAPGLRLETGAWESPAERPQEESGPAGTPELPAWAAHPAEIPPRPEQPLSPSDLGGAKALPGEGETSGEEARARGRHIHLLLEHLPRLPKEKWPCVAPAILAAAPDPCTEEQALTLLKEAEEVLTDPALSPLFAADALAEVTVTAALEELGGRRILGQIDLLIVREDHVRAIDFKTNRIVPERPEDVPDGLLRQMGAYGAALRQIYPDKRIDLAILWTAKPALMPLPHDLVNAALRRAALP